MTTNLDIPDLDDRTAKAAKSNFLAPEMNPKFAGKKSSATTLENIYKPIQYLGAKHRPLPVIVKKTLELVKPGTHVLDMFSGSTIVSQIFNLEGLNVISNDALKFNSVFSKSLLNIGRGVSDLKIVDHVLEQLKNFTITEVFTKPFREIIEIEKELLAKKETSQLLELYFGLPQVSKVLFLNGHNTHEQTKYIVKHPGESAINSFPLIANYYAGTYYSVAQALKLDELRNGIEYLYNEKQISEWLYNLLLTSLLHVSSKIVYTAGKHFAQPIRKENILTTPVLHNRFYEDRLKDVWDEFSKSVIEISYIASQNINSNKNLAYSETMENITSSSFTLPEISVIYADPPYTAQQYSRFYHIPEVIFTYEYPKLQVVNGKETSGIYPDNKFKSRFCSKRESYGAFTDLFEFASKKKSSLIISYSSSSSVETGNLRMIELNQLIELGNKYLSKCEVEVINFDFNYRQLNTSKKIVHLKNDKEFLIVFKQPSK